MHRILSLQLLPWLLGLVSACGGSSGSGTPSGGAENGAGAPGSSGAPANGGSPSAGGATSGGASTSGGTSSGGTVGSSGTPSGGAPAGGKSGSAGANAVAGSSGSLGTGGSGGTGAGGRAAGGAGGTNGATCNLTGAATPSTPTVWVIGDSTASLYATNLYPRMGWGQPLQDYFAPACARILDMARSGRSSKSFFDEGAWTPVRDMLRAGDYVLIQFGHNDEKIADATLYTEPFTTFEQYLSIYIDDSISRGAIPILLTPINRNDWTGAVLDDTHGNYPVAMRQLAQARSLALVDATALTKAYFERIGTPATTILFMNLAVGEFPNYPAGNADNTHLRETGARIIDQMILADLRRQGLPLGNLVNAVPTAP